MSDRDTGSRLYCPRHSWVNVAPGVLHCYMWSPVIICPACGGKDWVHANPYCTGQFESGVGPVCGQELQIMDPSEMRR